MMLQEFEELTGFYPSASLYEVIEAAYTEFHGDKRAFCEAYKANANGLATNIQQAATAAYLKAQSEADAKAQGLTKQVSELNAEIQRLKDKLEREEEWKPYESSHNVRQADYERLSGATDTEELSDSKAADMVAREFGFDRSLIEILHEVDREEINRHNQIRKVGTIPRKALFYSWDWNYICFEVRGIQYEMHNGALQMRCV